MTWFVNARNNWKRKKTSHVPAQSYTSLPSKFAGTVHNWKLKKFLARPRSWPVINSKHAMSLAFNYWRLLEVCRAPSGPNVTSWLVHFRRNNASSWNAIKTPKRSFALRSITMRVINTWYCGKAQQSSYLFYRMLRPNDDIIISIVVDFIFFAP